MSRRRAVRKRSSPGRDVQPGSLAFPAAACYGRAMLEMRPDCERCGVDLPADEGGAFICSFECTFCADCADALDDRCPNCGGELLDRPARTGKALKQNPASTERRFKG